MGPASIYRRTNGHLQATTTIFAGVECRKTLPLYLSETLSRKTVPSLSVVHQHPTIPCPRSGNGPRSTHSKKNSTTVTTTATAAATTITPTPTPTRQRRHQLGHCDVIKVALYLRPIGGHSVGLVDMDLSLRHLPARHSSGAGRR